MTRGLRCNYSVFPSRQMFATVRVGSTDYPVFRPLALIVWAVSGRMSMRWYVSFDGKTEGPLEEQAVAVLTSAIGTRLVVADEHTHRWIPVSESPFAGSIAEPPSAAITQTHKPSSNAAGIVIATIIVLVAIFIAVITLKPEPPPPPPLPSAAPMAAPQAASVTAPQDPIVSMSRKSKMKASFESLGYAFTSAPLESGMPRLMGEHPETSSVVELTGRDDFVERSALMVGFAKDDPDGLVWNTGAIMVFMRDLGWPDGQKWVTKNVRKGGQINKGGVDYSVVRIADTGVVMITAAPDKNSPEVMRQMQQQPEAK